MTRGVYGTISHGRSAYSHGRCRCDVCVTANREYMRSLRKKPAPSQHGESGYINYACRCDVCKAAGSVKNRRDREARAARTEAAS